MTVQELGYLLQEQKATLELENVPELKELLDQLEQYLQYTIYGLTIERMISNGLSVSLFGYAMSCLSDELPFKYLVVDKDGELNAWRIFEAAERKMCVKISDVINGPSAADELNNLLDSF